MDRKSLNERILAAGTNPRKLAALMYLLAEILYDEDPENVREPDLCHCIAAAEHYCREIHRLERR